MHAMSLPQTPMLKAHTGYHTPPDIHQLKKSQSESKLNINLQNKLLNVSQLDSQNSFSKLNANNNQGRWTKEEHQR